MYIYMDSSEDGFPVGRNSRKFLKWEHKRMKLPKRQRRVQGFTYSMPWHAIFAFLNPLLIGVLQVKGQGSDTSPFDTHLADMWTFLLATLVYCFACAANIKCHHQRTGSYSQISGHVALVSGSLSSISLLSIFLPSLLGRLIFFSWLILPIIVARQLNIRHFCHWLYQCTRKALLFLFPNTFGNRLRASNANLANELPLPPV